MKLTKYTHACIVLEEQGKKLVIDPGTFTKDLDDLNNVTAVVVTHVHSDHFEPKWLDDITLHNPGVQIFSTSDVASAYQQPHLAIVGAGQQVTVGPFRLAFYGEQHALIHESLPRPQNIGVLVNDTFFYPGDSYTKPDKPVELLAVPANAPWMRVGESMDYIAELKPKQCIPTHDGLLSETGHAVYYASLSKACDDNGATFTPLAPGESVDLN